MGCWNETCMVSNLPILSGEKVKLNILQSSYDTNIVGKSGYVYSTGMLYPAFLPISAEYNDYGCIENAEEDWNYKLIEQFLKNEFGNVLLCDKVEIKDWKLMDLIEGIERGHPKYKKRDEWVDCGLSTTMIRQDVWELCVMNQSGYADYWNLDRTPTNNAPYSITGKTWEEKTFNAFVDSIKINFDDPLEQLRHQLSVMGRNEIFQINGENKSIMSTYAYKELCVSKKDDDKFLQDVKRQWSEWQMVSGSISNLRKGWMVQPGCGSQDCDWVVQKEFYKGLVDICDKQIEKDEEYD